MFRMLCSNDRVGSIIGKGGIIIRTLQSETGAAIKVVDAISDSDERIIVISAREVCASFLLLLNCLCSLRLISRLSINFFPLECLWFMMLLFFEQCRIQK